MAANTGASSPRELEITLSTSEVAVCCSNASASSRVRCCSASNRRTFAIAITAWSAKVVTSSICLSVNGATVLRIEHDDADRPPLAQQRIAEHRALLVHHPVVRIGENVGHLHRGSLERRAPRPTIDEHAAAPSAVMCAVRSGVNP